MNKSSRIKLISILLGLGVAVTILLVFLRTTSLGAANFWLRQASPGRLSDSHAFLESNCAACHTSVRGVEAANCTVCHANNESLLQRQPTAFHGDVLSCRECHPEHQGGKRPPSTMDHGALAKIGLRQPGDKDAPDSERALLRKQLVAWINRQENAVGTVASHPHVTPLEAVLNCAACHATKDRHFGFFGQDCAQCHATTRWSISEFWHPSPRSTDCAQCHQAPPCHYMTEHFNKVCAVVAGQPQAQVNQCYLCHQTTAWNDIKGFGWCKCH
jgi:hypothetical protein